jgi:hypothetical protein
MPRPGGKRPAVRLSTSLAVGHHAVLPRRAEWEDQSLAGMVCKAVAECAERYEASGQADLLPSAGPKGVRYEHTHLS